MKKNLLIWIFISITFPSCVKQCLPPLEGVFIRSQPVLTPIQDSIKRFLEKNYLDMAYVDFDGSTDSVMRINVIQTRHFDEYYLYNPIKVKAYWRNDVKEITEGPGFHDKLLLFFSSRGTPVSPQTPQSLRLDWHLDFYKDNVEQTIKLLVKSDIDETIATPI